ncbi:MAG: efflux RND transporter periplasmic adaptor subunit [Sideroxydans sp.]|nr:efflux RND transporter periplasmic adaptor subunit [Sideroxydans sp.]
MKRTSLILILPLMFAACGKEVPQAVKVERPAETIVVGALATDSGNLYSGEVHARFETVLGFRIGGKLIERLVDVGAVVRKGQVLARLDGADTGLQASASSAQLQLAVEELKRYRELRAQGFVSQSALDAKETALKAAEAQAGLASNQAAYTSLLADRDGVVSATYAEVGQVVGAGQSVLRVAQHGEREVLISIPESRFTSVHVGMPAEVVLSAAGSGQHVLPGHVREISPAADPASRTYPARVAFEAKNSQVALGMTANVRLLKKADKGAAQAGSGFLIPMTAVFQQGDQAAVWVVTADRSVTLRAVTVASYRDDGAVISSGIQSGERIVRAGVHKLAEGEKIVPIENGHAS